MHRCASLDGDADRLVYFQGAPGGGLQLLDGDRIAVLAALLIRDILGKLPSDISSPSVSPNISLERHKCKGSEEACDCFISRYSSLASQNSSLAAALKCLCEAKVMICIRNP